MITKGQFLTLVHNTLDQQYYKNTVKLIDALIKERALELYAGKQVLFLDAPDYIREDIIQQYRENSFEIKVTQYSVTIRYIG